MAAQAKAPLEPVSNEPYSLSKGKPLCMLLMLDKVVASRLIMSPSGT